MANGNGNQLDTDARLAALSDAMLTVFDTHPARQEDDKAIIVLQADNTGGFIHDFEADGDAIMYLFHHLEIIFQSNGLQISVTPIEPSNPSERINGG